MMFVFALISFGRVLLMKSDPEKFIKNFTGEKMGDKIGESNNYEEPSFSKQEGIFQPVSDTFFDWKEKYWPIGFFIVINSAVILLLKLYLKLPDMTISTFTISSFIFNIYLVNIIVYIVDLLNKKTPDTSP
jgi:hypothetical protein